MKITNLFFCLICFSAFSQNPMPGSKQSKAILLSGGTIHVGNGQVLERSNILFENGVISAIGNVTAPAGAEVIDVTGKSVYPSLIAPNSQAGLIEIESVRATNDMAEIGSINPNVHSYIAYNTDSELIPTIRANGILVSQVVPLGGVLSGQSSIIEQDGWNWEDATLKKDDGVWINWPGYYKRSFDFEEFKFKTSKNDKMAEEIRELKQYFMEAKAYAEIAKPTSLNIKFEAVKGLFNGSKSFFVNANDSKEVFEAVKFSKELGIKKIVIVGAENAEMAYDLLKSNNIPVLVTGTHRLPNYNDEDVWNPYKLPSNLKKAGLKVGMFYNESTWRTRNLPFVAGTAAGYGLNPEEALEMITKTNAEILGIDKQLGTLEVGKQATIVVSEGDILDMKTNKVILAFIRGKRVSLDDKQKRLGKKFAEKYEINLN
jgi:imidazolonepropionase-like amidohydrolase